MKEARKQLMEGLRAISVVYAKKAHGAIEREEVFRRIPEEPRKTL